MTVGRLRSYIMGLFWSLQTRGGAPNALPQADDDYVMVEPAAAADKRQQRRHRVAALNPSVEQPDGCEINRPCGKTAAAG